MKTKFLQFSMVIFLLTLIISTVATNVSFAAEDYKIRYADWDDSNGYLIATWEKAAKSTSYRVQLYKGSVKVGNEVGKEATTSSDSKDLTAAIVKKGTGTYYFTVYPTKGGEDMMIVSSALEVDGDVLKSAREAQGTSSTNSTKLPYAIGNSGSGVAKWISNPGGSWSYYLADGTKVKNKFYDVAGYTYYFNKSGLTLYGWQFLNNRWYYFEPKGTGAIPQGAMYKGCTTPDGYLVNEKGEWVLDGVVQTTKVKANTTGKTSASAATKPTSKGNTIQTISKCTISLKVDPVSEAGPSCAVPSGATNSKIVDYSYSTPFENWTAGSYVTITAIIEPNSGYKYASNVKFSCSGGTILSSSGSETQKTVSIKYVPQQKLSAPSGLYCYQDDSTLHWDKVKSAKRYKVIVYNGNKQITSSTITETEFDLGEYVYNDDYANGIRVKISALPSEGNKHIKESDVTEISDFQSFMETSGVPADFERDGSNITYSEAGWQKIAGEWYYFSPSNNKAISGWFHDPATMYWYYFDKTTKRMLVGYNTIDNVRYYLNDGSVAGVPLGAWIEGK